MLMAVNPPVIVPHMCDITYECVSILGADPDVKCNDPVSVYFDPTAGTFSFQSFDVSKYSPGTY